MGLRYWPCQYSTGARARGMEWGIGEVGSVGYGLEMGETSHYVFGKTTIPCLDPDGCRDPSGQTPPPGQAHSQPISGGAQAQIAITSISDCLILVNSQLRQRRGALAKAISSITSISLRYSEVLNVDCEGAD